MQRKDIVARATEILHSSGYRKPVKVPDHTFTISDDTGQAKTFKVKGSKSDALLNQSDVEAVLDAVLETAREGLRRGEPVCIKGFGRLEIKELNRSHYTMMDGNVYEAHHRYTPRFYFGNELRRCAETYQASLDETKFKEQFDAIEEFDKEGKWLEAFYAKEEGK